VPAIRKPFTIHCGKLEKPRGIRFATVRSMSGSTASEALHARFDAIRRAELERLKKKLAGLTEADRAFVHQVTTDVVDALARGPERVLAEDSPSVAVEALVRLFGLEA
jgi:glutamyl-tRNA reductase